ncbi:nuclear membrane fusion protein Kar5 [Phlyctema vagabunda]|uniref:Nuclear membrane fusion protein Kar5 n=1 Tax=Phlyctema vagabunda TaxID=108571 RepID=A0ABR4PFA2_9HELO
MKVSHILALVLTPVSVFSYNPFKGSRESTQPDGKPLNPSKISGIASIANPSTTRQKVSSKFDPVELLESRSRKPEIYTKAMMELKRLEEEPLCHRLAAQMLMNNCQGLENVDENDYQFNSVRFQRHHIESFAASLALCDLERGRFTIPGACTPFTSEALLKISHEGKENLDVSPEQVGKCLEALGQDHSHWNTWLSYRDKALLFCRAARIDIDKDQSILLHSQLTRIMKDFADGMEKDLNTVREAMAEHTRTTESYFQSAVVNAEILNTKIRATFHSFAKDITGTAASLKHILDSAGDVQRALRNIFDMVVQTNLDMAEAQQHAMEVTTTRAKSRIEDIDIAVGATETSVDNLRITVEMLIPVLQSLVERQEALDLGAKHIYARVDNITVLLDDHHENLKTVSSITTEFHETLGKTLASAESLNNRLGFNSKTSDSLIVIGSGLFMLLAGNYGLAPSLARNAVLLCSGLAMGQCMNVYRRWEWGLNGSQPTAFTHLAKTWLSAESPESPTSIIPTAQPEFTHQFAQIDMI